jgi:hypothetical protein
MARRFRVTAPPRWNVSEGNLPTAAEESIIQVSEADRPSLAGCHNGRI